MSEFEGNDSEDLGVFEAAKKAARDSTKGQDLRTLVERMQELGQQKTNLEDQLKVVNAWYDVLRMEAIPTAMEDAGIERVAYDGIGRVSLTPDVLVSVKSGAKDDLFEWLDQHKFGDLIQPTLNSSTLKAFVKGRIKKGEELPNDFLNVTPIVRASITKGK